MTIVQFLSFHKRFKAHFKVEPVYTGSVSLLLEGYTERLPKDIDIVMDDNQYELLEQDGGVMSPDYDDEHFVTYLSGIKIDVLRNNNYEKEIINLFGQQFHVIPSRIAIQKKLEFVKKHIATLEEGKHLNDINMQGIVKHIADINYFNSKAIRSIKNEQTLKLPF